MLERFERVKKVGLFEDYSHSPGLDLGEVTLIYGENGVGKSTLAAILDSLRERNAGEIIRRRSLPGDVAPTVAVSLSGKVYTFDGRDWDDQLPYDTLDVFYSGFVTRNVHAATAVDPNHRRNLCELVLGWNAVQKVTKLAQADNEGRAALAEMKAIDKELQLLIKKPDTLETFLGLPNDPEIDEHLENVRAELKEALSKDAILARVVPEAVALPTVDRNATTTLMEKSADGIGEDVAAVVRAHINEHLDNDGENWLAYGARHTGTDNKCPFCGQDIAGSSLVAAIRSYFSAEYRVYTELLSLEIQAIRDELGTTAFPHIRAALSSQVAVAAQWADEMPIDQSAIATTLTEAEAVWKSAAGKLEGVVGSKQSKPLERMEPALAEEALAEYEPAVAMLVKVNDILSASAKKAQERKAALSKVDTTEIEQRLRRLENQKVRFEPLAQDMLRKRNALIEKRATIDGEKTGLKKEIDEHASGVVGKYQVGINHYLEHFGCDIRIEAIEPRYPSGKASVQYTLKARGHKIGLGLSATGPCFETVLSEGDKSTLALSFFFAGLRDHTSLAGRTVVLDDPVNSLGSSRRTLIEGVVRDLRVRGAQVVVLTHDERLAAMMWRDKKLGNIVPLQVEKTNRGSQLLPWDVDRATQSEYVEHYLTLHDFLENGGDHRPSAACIRPYVEQRLRHLFPGPPFQTRDTLGQMIAKIRDSDPGSRLDVLRASVPDLESINEASLPSHHATDDVPGMTPLTPEGVRLFAQKALDVLL
jgi:wobble nucleotide-excising tRNase